MSTQRESFNMNLLKDVPANAAGGGPDGDAPGGAGEDAGSSFAAQLAGGGAGEFIVPAQPKKLSTGMIVFFTVAAVAGGSLWWMHQRTGGPSAAEAADPNVDAARASIRQFLAGGSGSVEEIKTLLADSGQITEQFATYNDNRQVPLEELKTNPFWFQSTDEQVALPDNSGERTRLQREEQARREAEAARREQERIAAEAGKLQVQTIFYGKSPSAMIDGKICRVGQALGEFTVTAIRADVVEVRHGDYLFELRIKK